MNESSVGTAAFDIAVERASGREAAQKVHYCIERQSMSKDEGWKRFLALSFDLNTRRVPEINPKRLIRFVHKVATYLPYSDEVEKPWQLEPVPQIIREYLKTNDSVLLIRSIEDIPNNQ